MPVILIVYDALSDIAYWVYIQAYFAQQPGFDLRKAGETITIHLRKTDAVNAKAMREFARFKTTLLNQIQVASSRGNAAQSRIRS